MTNDPGQPVQTCPAKGVQPQGSGETHRLGDIVGAGTRLKLLQKPQPLLCERDWRRSVSVDACE